MRELDVSKFLNNKISYSVVDVYSTNGIEYHVTLAGSDLAKFDSREDAILFINKLNENKILKKLAAAYQKLEKIKKPIDSMCLSEFPEASEENFWRDATRDDLERIALYDTVIARLIKVILDE